MVNKKNKKTVSGSGVASVAATAVPSVPSLAGWLKPKYDTNTSNSIIATGGNSSDSGIAHACDTGMLISNDVNYIENIMPSSITSTIAAESTVSTNKVIFPLFTCSKKEKTSLPVDVDIVLVNDTIGNSSSGSSGSSGSSSSSNRPVRKAAQDATLKAQESIHSAKDIDSAIKSINCLSSGSSTANKRKKFENDVVSIPDDDDDNKKPSTTVIAAANVHSFFTAKADKCKAKATSKSSANASASASATTSATTSATAAIASSASSINRVDLTEKFQLEMHNRCHLGSKAFASTGVGVNDFFLQKKTKVNACKKETSSISVGDTSSDSIGSTSTTSNRISSSSIDVDVLFPKVQSVGVSVVDVNVLLLPPYRSTISNSVSVVNSNTCSCSSSSSSITVVDLVDSDDAIAPSVPNARAAVNIYISDSKADLRMMFTDYGLYMYNSLSRNVGNMMECKTRSSNNLALVDMCQLKCLQDAIGCNSNSIKHVYKWLAIWAGKRRAKKKKTKRSSRRSNYDDDEQDISAIMSNVMLIYGATSGTGKTAIVHTIASELGYNVIEINCCQLRTGAIVKKQVVEASQSQSVDSNGVVIGGRKGSSTSSSVSGSSSSNNDNNNNNNNNSSSSSNVKELNLILFDDVDVVFDDECSTFYSSIQSLVKISKCPVILTSASPYVQDSFKFHVDAEVVCIAPATAASTATHVTQMLCQLGINHTYEEDDSSDKQTQAMTLLSHISSCDVRAMLHTLHLIHDSMGSRSCFKHADIFQWLQQQQCLYHAKLDYLTSNYYTHTSTSTSIATISSTSSGGTNDGSASYCGILSPVVYTVKPRKIAINSVTTGTLPWVTVTGKNFMQRNYYNGSNDSTDVCMQIEVCMNSMPCIYRIVGDTSLFVQLPAEAIDAVGQYNIVVSVIDSISATRSISTQSSICGTSSSWFILYDDSVKLTVKASTYVHSASLHRYYTVNNGNTTTSCSSSDDDEFLEDVEYSSRVGNKQAKALPSADGDGNSNRAAVKGSRRIIIDDDDDDEVCEDGPTAVVQSATTTANTSWDSYSVLIHECMDKALSYLMSLVESEPFLEPVDSDVPDYCTIVTDPIDLTTISIKLSTNRYHIIPSHISTPATATITADIVAFVDDVRRIWSNCHLYNDSSDEICVVADVLSNAFEGYLCDTLSNSFNTSTATAVVDPVGSTHTLTVDRESGLCIEGKTVITFLPAIVSASSTSISSSSSSRGTSAVNTDASELMVDAPAALSALQTQELLLQAEAMRSTRTHMRDTAFYSIGSECEDEDYQYNTASYHQYQQSGSDEVAALEAMYDLLENLSFGAQIVDKHASCCAFVDDNYSMVCSDDIDAIYTGSSSSNSSSSRYNYSCVLLDIVSEIDSISSDILKSVIGNNASMACMFQYTSDTSTVADTATTIAVPTDTAIVVDKAIDVAGEGVLDSDDDSNDDSDDDSNGEWDCDDTTTAVGATIATADTYTSMDTSDQSTSINSWHRNCDAIQSTYLQHLFRKRMYQDFVRQRLAMNPSRRCFYRQAISINTVCREVSLDLLPMLSQMLHFEMMNSCSSNNSSNADWLTLLCKRSTRSKGKKVEKYIYAHNVTGLSVDVLEQMYQYGYVESIRAVSYSVY